MVGPSSAGSDALICRRQCALACSARSLRECGQQRLPVSLDEIAVVRSPNDCLLSVVPADALLDSHLPMLDLISHPAKDWHGMDPADERYIGPTYALRVLARGLPAYDPAGGRTDPVPYGMGMSRLAAAVAHGRPLPAVRRSARLHSGDGGRQAASGRSGWGRSARHPRRAGYGQ